MPKTTSPKTFSAIFIFAAGILLATALTTILTWANLEADFYGFQRYASDEHLSGLSCPALMTRHETASISVKVSNTASREITPIVRIDTSTPSVPDTKQEQWNLQPGEAKTLTQSVSAENIDLGFFIFAKAFRYPAYPLPSAEATCGVMVLDLPVLSGAQIFWAWLTLSLALTPLGLWQWSRSFGPNEAHREESAVRALALVSLIGLFVSIQGVWMAGVLFLALTLLLAAAILRLVTSA